MKSRKGFTLIELLVVIFIIGILLSIVIGGIVFAVCAIKGCDTVSTAIDNHQAATEERLESNPPIYKIGDIVYHKASDAKMIVAKKYITWNKAKEGWDMKVKTAVVWMSLGALLSMKPR